MVRQRSVLKLSFLILVASTLVFSQSYTAAIRGLVTDSTGAAIPNAKVVVTEVERNLPHPVNTDEAGRYVVTALPPGAYTLTVEVPGFKTFVRKGFPLSVQQQATIDVRLELGEVASTVEITGAAPLLNTTIANLGQVVENKFIVSMPNIGRDSMNLIYLTPGVVGAAGRVGDTNTNFVANGARNSTSDVLLDGVTVVTMEQNTGITDLKYKPSVDAVQEFKMQTNFFSAEYGQSGGAVVNMITKSGTNDFHGDAYYFFRHSDLNANNWFSNRNNRPVPFYRRDQFGGILGGPVKKDKTFFFTTYEYTKSQSPLSYTATFPTDLQRDGNFSQTFHSDGKPVNIFDPFDTYTDASGKTLRRPFGGNIIPKSRFDPVAVKALTFFPRQNQVTNAVTNANNWFAEGINESRSHQMDFKGDHNFTDKMRLTGRYSYQRTNGVPPNLFGEGNPAYTFNDGPSMTRNHSVVADFTRTENATTLWTLRYGLIYATYGRTPFEPFDVTTLGFPQYMKDNVSISAFPTIAPGGYDDIGTQGWLIMDRQEGVHQISGALNKTLGAHNVKTGAEFRRYFLDYAQPGYPAGQFAFGARLTGENQDVSSSYQGNGLASMLLGFGDGSNFHFDPKAFSRSGYWGVFIQDDWKISRKLTLNLGLRYEIDIPRYETQNRYSYWDLNAAPPISVPGYDLRGAFRFVDDNNRSPFNTDKNNFSPRIGLAYALNNKTSIRTGVGILYSVSRATVAGHTGSGYTTNSTVTWTLDNYKTQYAHLSNPWPDGMLVPFGRSKGDASFLGLNVDNIVRENRNPELYSWNFSIQREAKWNSIVEINYTGSKGAHLLVPFNSLTPLDPRYWLIGPGLNPQFTRTELNAMVPNPFYGVITDPKANNLKNPTAQRNRLLRPMPHFDGAQRQGGEPGAGDSIYNAMQLKFEKRMSHGVAMLAHYTWSKMIDTASVTSSNTTWLGGTANMQNPFNYAMERALSSNDIPHRFVMSGSWELPFGQGRYFGKDANRAVDAFIGGWEITALLTMQSGMPMQVQQNNGTLWVGNQRPNLVGDPSTSGSVQDRLNTGWFNPAAFTQPASDVYGTAARYLNYRGPAINSFNAALLKNWKITENQRAEFRLEAQNAFNHPVFSDPASLNFGASNFGTITGTKVGPRNVQLGFKYYF